MRKLATIGVLAVLVAGLAACSPKLEEGEVLEKEGDTFTVRLSRTIDEPIDKVWQALQTPGRLEKYAESYQQTKVVKEEGNVKVVDYRVKALGQLQAFTMELTMQPDEKKVNLKTLESSIATVDGSYELTPGPSPDTTIITYRAIQKDKANIPAPVSVQKTAIKGLFDDLVDGLKKGIEDDAQG